MTRAAAPAWTLPRGLDGYLRDSERPWVSLIALLPLILFYELANAQWGTAFIGEPPRHVVAFGLMREFFAMFGATGQLVPALGVVGALLGWHLARSDPWRARASTVATMMAEATVLAVPLVLLGAAVARFAPLMATWEDLRAGVILSVGAGIYEELVFRLLGFALLSFLLGDLLGLPKRRQQLLVVGICAVLFSLYHYLGNESFRWETFAFRTAAGAYFGALLLTRGFGITALCHIAYDLIVVAHHALR